MVAVSCNPYEESKEHGRPQAAKKSPVGSFLVFGFHPVGMSNVVAAAAFARGIFNLTRTGIAAELTAASEQRLPPVGGRCRIATKRGVQGSEAGAVVSGILLGGFYSLMGMGQNIIFGVMNIVNFCHGEMLMVGMYITYVLYTYFGVDPYVALPIVAVLMFGLGALIQSTLITPSLKTKSFTNLLFLTVGLGLLLTNGALVIFGSTYYKIITPYSQTYIPLGPVTIALPRLVSFLILIVVAIALFAFLKYSTTGKQIRAVSQNPIGAEVVGINVKKIYILTYGLGVALAGIAGSLLTQFYTIYPTAGASFGFRALIVVVVGGLGSIPGAFFAGIFLGLLEQMSALFISPSYSDMIVFVTFIIILVVRQVMILRRR